MVIYDSIDSDNLMNAMSANLKNAKELFSRLTKGSAHLVEVVDSGVLSSAANTAGRDLFKTYIDPMIQNLSNAIDDIESDLTSYRTAEGMARQHESHLDEELLKKQLNATKNLIRLVQKKIDDDKDLMKNLQLAAHGNFSKIGDNLGNLPGLDAQLENLEHSKSLYEQQIAALRTFESSTAPLFTDSLQSFKYALQGVDIINQSKASPDGSITFPLNSNMKWLSDIKSQKLNSNLAGNQDKSILPDTKKVEIKNIQNDTLLTPEEKADRIAQIYEDYLYSLAPDAFDNYDKNRLKLRKKYGDDFKDSPEYKQFEKELTNVLQGLPIDILKFTRGLGDDVTNVSDKQSLIQFYNMVQTKHPLDLKNRTFGDSAYSIWARNWSEDESVNGINRSEDYLGNYLFGYYGRKVEFEGDMLKTDAGLAQMWSDINNKKMPNWTGSHDNPGDTEEIQAGIDDYDKKHKKN